VSFAATMCHNTEEVAKSLFSRPKRKTQNWWRVARISCKFQTHFFFFCFFFFFFLLLLLFKPKIWWAIYL
jgi:hypothetical protein